MNRRRGYGNRLERAIDAAVFGTLIVMAIQTQSAFTRIAALIAAAFVLFGRIVAWRRR
jgi:hypothetical protein